MATTKTTAAATTGKKVETAAKTSITAAEKKVEAKPAAKKAEAKPVAKKTEAKPVAKKAEAKPVAKKAEAKPAAKKTAAKKTAKKENNVFVQFQGMEFDTTAIEAAVKADYTAKNGKKTMTSVSIYIKPEDMKAYYVIDGIIGDVAL